MFWTGLFLLLVVIAAVRVLSGADNKTRPQLPQVYDALFDGRPQITYEVPPGVKAAEVVEAGGDRGYELVHTIPGKPAPTLVFDRRRG